ncbi:MAG: hypothetical protein IAE83_12685 [Anaerolinea sp.]|nr:hypothetical protein [Anaerolinea sp.]MCC6973095.1 hypothetical protein [Anaerolineae bacterium]CAG1015789.1 hypothetical protein ANRL4_05594 [Anaerolineae bacterium]
MISFRRCLLIGLVLMAVGSGACEPTDPPPPTRPPAEPAITYMGPLEGTQGQIALIVTPTRAIGVVCGQGTDWRVISAWLSDGQISAEGELSIVSETPQRQISAQISPGQAVGHYKFGGVSYAFQAVQVADPASIQAGAQQGLYRLEIPLKGMDQEAALLTLLVPDATQDVLCGMLFEGGVPRSRVLLSGVWQEGLSTFTLPDLRDQEGKPTVWFGVGTLGQIDSILLP